MLSFVTAACGPDEMCIDLDDTGSVSGSLPGVTFKSSITGPKGTSQCSRQAVLNVSQTLVACKHYILILGKIEQRHCLY